MRSSGRAFVLQARRRGEDGAIRVGFTVSRQVGNAVERNRVRRRLREIVRLSAAAGRNQLRPGHDYVLIGRRAALAAPFGEMMQELDAALDRLHAAGSGGTGGARRDPLHEARFAVTAAEAAAGPQKAAKLARTPAARALNDRAQEHHPCHRAVAHRGGRLAIFHRLCRRWNGSATMRSSSSKSKRSCSRRPAGKRQPGGAAAPQTGSSGGPGRSGRAPPSRAANTREALDRGCAARRHRHAAAQAAASI